MKKLVEKLNSDETAWLRKPLEAQFVRSSKELDSGRETFLKGKFLLVLLVPETSWNIFFGPILRSFKQVVIHYIPYEANII